MNQAGVLLHEELLERIRAEVGKQGLSEFMREAAERELARRERAARRKPD